MPWPSVAWTDAAARQELAALLAVQGIPTLVLLDQDLNVIADDARASVNDDPEGKVVYRNFTQGHILSPRRYIVTISRFESSMRNVSVHPHQDYPWRPEAVSLFTERLATRLHDHPALILFVGTCRITTKAYLLR